MKNKKIIYFGALAGILTAVAAAAVFLFSSPEKAPALKVMVYPSFLSPYGPGVEIKKQFEKVCACRILWMRAEDSTTLVQRLSLREDGMGVDVVLGLDQITLPLAYRFWKWKNFNISKKNFTLNAKKWIEYQRGIMNACCEEEKHKIWAVPLSWAPLTFISRVSLKSAPLKSIIKNPQWKNKISIPHPRSSTLGLQLYFWFFSVLGEADLPLFLLEFKKQIYSTAHSWSSSYGLFQKEFAHLTWSYQTSLIYHQMEENKKYFAWTFKEGHPYQVEFMAVPNTCRSCALAEQFVKFMLTKEVQRILMNKNYMLPVIQGAVKGSAFEALAFLPLISYEKLDAFLAEKDQWMELWQNTLDR